MARWGAFARWTVASCALAFVFVECTPFSNGTVDSQPDGAVSDSSADGSGSDVAAVVPVNEGGSDARADAAIDASVYVKAVLASGPIAYYRLGELAGPARDVVGDHSGAYGANTMRGGAPLITGDIDPSTSFPGADAADVANVVTAPQSTVLEPKDGLTIECWVSPLSTPAVVRQEIVSYGDDVNPPYQAWVLLLAGNHADLFTQVTNDVVGSAIIPTSSTSYLVATYDKVNGVRIYLNGVLDGQAQPNGSLTYTIDGLGIGGGVSGRGNFNGAIDEVAIYSRALTINEIATHYLAGAVTP